MLHHFSDVLLVLPTIDTTSSPLSPKSVRLVNSPRAARTVTIRALRLRYHRRASKWDSKLISTSLKEFAGPVIHVRESDLGRLTRSVVVTVKGEISQQMQFPVEKPCSGNSPMAP